MTDDRIEPRPIRTDDGSFTFYHPRYKQHYHAREGARSETLAKFIEPSHLVERLQRQESVVVLDIGFGLGGNAFGALDVADGVAKGYLCIHSFENDPEALQRARVCATDSYESRIRDLISSSGTRTAFGELQLHCSDLRTALRDLRLPPVDIVFHDPFSPQKNVEAWTQDLFTLFHHRLAPNGVLVTYSEAYAVRAGLQNAGFAVGVIPPARGQRGGTIACIRESDIAYPLPEEVQSILKGRKGTPYRDPTLSSSRQEIFRRRQEEMDALEP